MAKFEFTNRTFIELLSSLSYLIDIEEKEKLYHSWKVAVISTKFSEIILPEESNLIFYAGLIHDFGAVGALTHIIHLPRIEQQLNEPRIKEHPQRSAKLAETMPGISQTASYIYEHHELWNGNGYPEGKKDDKILLGSQILHISDWYDIKTRYESIENIVKLIKQKINKDFSDYIANSFINFLNSIDKKINYAYGDKLEQIFEETKNKIKPIVIPVGVDAMGKILKIFAIVIDSKHKYTASHSERVSRYCIRIAQILNLPHDEITKVRFAGFLHDLGKVATPQKIIDKPEALTDEEWDIVKQHPIITINALKKIHGMEEIGYIAGHHHEKFDGTGYPDKLKGEEIPFLTRVITIADAFDALRSTRAYREYLSYDNALKILKENSGSQFDPRIVDCLFTDEFKKFHEEMIKAN